MIQDMRSRIQVINGQRLCAEVAQHVNPAKSFISGGDDGIRTHGLCVANAPLSHLSYIPTITNSKEYIPVQILIQYETEGQRFRVRGSGSQVQRSWVLGRRPQPAEPFMNEVQGSAVQGFRVEKRSRVQSPESRTSEPGPENLSEPYDPLKNPAGLNQRKKINQQVAGDMDQDGR
jgi:hypothetical protein